MPASPTRFWAPLHAVLKPQPPGNAGYPPSAAPSAVFAGQILQDHRMQLDAGKNSAWAAGIVGWYMAGGLMVANIVPSTAAVNNIAAAHAAASGVPQPLVNASGAGITVLTVAAPAQFMPSLLTLSAGVVIDGLPSFARFGAAVPGYITAAYNRSTTVGRCISVTGVAGGTGGTFVAKGYDCYGYPMTQNIVVAAGANTVNSTKAFKAVTSVTPNFTDAGHNYSVGTADIFGFGVLASFFGDTDIFWNSTAITANTGFVAADTTSPATATTGDVRGTYAVQSASDGTKRLQMYVQPTLGSLVTDFTKGLFGQPQV